MKKLKFILVIVACVFLCTSIYTANAIAEEKAVVPSSSPMAGQKASSEKSALVGDIGLSGKLGEAIAKTPVGDGKGQIDPNAPRGFAGIPGAPKINLMVALFWGIWAGWLFSTIGAFGGIMAGVGHLTIFGLGDYGRTFKQTNPTLNKLMTDSIRVSNQWLGGFAAVTAAFNFFKRKRLVWPLGLFLGLGSVAGALLIPWMTAGKIKLSQYMGYFGIAVLSIGIYLFYETTSRGLDRRKKSTEAARAFEKTVKEKQVETTHGVKITNFSFKKISFTFYGQEFSFNPILPVIGGFVIASIASFIGVGGGFLYVPFMTSIVGLPMFIVAGTSGLAVLISMIVSIFTFMVIKGTFISWSLVGVELIGVFTGAMIGPKTQKYIPEVWLKRLFVVLAFYVGIRYISKGFFGQSWLPPY